MAGTAAAVAAAGLDWRALATPPSPTDGILVLLTLDGGNDGLNTVIPYHDPAYHSARPNLGFAPNEVLPLDNDLALNPALQGLRGVWGRGQLAIVRGVGYPNPSFSHFRSADIWATAVPDAMVDTGWLGRWLDQVASTNPLAAVSIGSAVPRVLQGASTMGAAIPSGTFGLPVPEAAFADLERAFSGETPLAARVAESGAELLDLVHAVHTATKGSDAHAASGLAGHLDLVTRLVAGGLPARAYVVSFGGFDTHAGERSAHQRLLGEMDAALTGFLRSADPRVVVVVTSEFGRRLAQNASGGTDHGSAAPVLVAGPRVHGGFYGDEPSLTDLASGNLKYTTDFRRVYTTVAERVLGIDPSIVVPGKSWEPLGFA